MDPLNPMPPQQTVMMMLAGKFVSLSLGAAAELGVADHLAGGPTPVARLAEQCAASPDALYRTLRMLAAVGVFDERPGQVFANNAFSEVLRSDVPGSMRSMARWLGGATNTMCWAQLLETVRHGAPAVDVVLGGSIFEHFGRHPAEGAVFNGAMTDFSRQTALAAAEAGDWPATGTFVDVGGGVGFLLSTLLGKSSAARGVLFELPAVAEAAVPELARFGQAERIEVQGGDFLAAVPRGGDLYTMKHVLHDWDDDRCVRILSNCRAAMNDGGRVVVLEQVLTDAPEAAMTKMVDLEMLVMTPGGRERTADEFGALFTRAGLRLSRITPTASPICLIEGVSV